MLLATSSDARPRPRTAAIGLTVAASCVGALLHGLVVNSRRWPTADAGILRRLMGGLCPMAAGAWEAKHGIQGQQVSAVWGSLHQLRLSGRRRGACMLTGATASLLVPLRLTPHWVPLTARVPCGTMGLITDARPSAERSVLERPTLADLSAKLRSALRGGGRSLAGAARHGVAGVGGTTEASTLANLVALPLRESTIATAVVQ